MDVLALFFLIRSSVKVENRQCWQNLVLLQSLAFSTLQMYQMYAGSPENFRDEKCEAFFSFLSIFCVLIQLYCRSSSVRPSIKSVLRYVCHYSSLSMCPMSFFASAPTFHSLPKAGLSEHQPVKLRLMLINSRTVSLTTSAPLLARCS